LSAQDFKATQQKCTRVKTAYSEKWESLKGELAKKGINKESFEMYIRVFKNDKIVEVWLRSKEQKEYKLFKTYNICASSGELGPKRQQGDGQVPEGFYNVAAFNPYSSYYLSLGVSYPNASDKIVGKGNLGGDIMIHGNCVTIGCMPLTDNYIKEVYVLAVEARNNGQQSIPIHIFPTKLDENGMAFLTKESSNPALLNFWKNLKTGYDYFEQNKMLPKVTVDKAGKYIFN
jgi:murein L,D-transpeptidase YafK